MTTVHADFTNGEKRLTVNCPAGERAMGGGFLEITGGVVSSYRSDASAHALGTTSWTVTKSSASPKGEVYAYCAAAS